MHERSHGRIHIICSKMFNNVQHLFSPVTGIMSWREAGFPMEPALKSRQIMPEIAKRKVGRARTGSRAACIVDGAMTIRLQPDIRLTDKQLARFCRDNDGFRVEQTAKGDLIIMAPVFSDGGQREAELVADFVVWSREVKSGQIFGPSAGFTLPDSSMLSPDVSWVAQERLNKMTKKDWQSFMPLCPDFVLELRSRSDRLPILQKKMGEYIANGARLGWLIDPLEKQVFVYRPEEKVVRLKHPATLSGEPVLAGFTLDLARVW